MKIKEWLLNPHAIPFSQGNYCNLPRLFKFVSFQNFVFTILSCNIFLWTANISRNHCILGKLFLELQAKSLSENYLVFHQKILQPFDCQPLILCNEYLTKPWHKLSQPFFGKVFRKLRLQPIAFLLLKGLPWTKRQTSQWTTKCLNYFLFPQKKAFFTTWYWYWLLLIANKPWYVFFDFYKVMFFDKFFFLGPNTA